ncbi:MAG: helicase-related protein, partial [Nanoarchaeota archaeon]
SPKVLIISPTQIIRDKEWKEQFEKWSTIEFNDVTSHCIQTCYKLMNTHWDLIVCDEIHRYIPKNDTVEYKYYKFFQNNTWDKILGLSASISKDISFRLNKIAPVIYSIDTNKARELEIVAPFDIYNISVELTKLEKFAYDSLSKQIDIAKFRGYHAWKAINKRRTLLYNAFNKTETIKSIIDYMKGQGIIFSQHIEYADNISKIVYPYGGCVSYHSGIDKKERQVRLDRFINNEVRLISAATALDEGLNIPNLKFAVIAAGTSKERSFIQRLGRIIRLLPGKKAILIRLYVKETQDEKWLKSSQIGYKTQFINNISEVKKIMQ